MIYYNKIDPSIKEYVVNLAINMVSLAKTDI
jgi:hypothetical protein